MLIGGTAPPWGGVIAGSTSCSVWGGMCVGHAFARFAAGEVVVCVMCSAWVAWGMEISMGGGVAGFYVCVCVGGGGGCMWSY